MTEQIEITGSLEHDGQFNVTEEVKKAVRAFEEAHHVKSFSGRHPELGRMIKCVFCSSRHRETVVCEQTYVKDENGAPRTGANIPGQYPRQTRRGALGVLDNTKGKRILPHHSHKLLQLVQLTQDTFPLEVLLWGTPKEAMHRARTLASRFLKAKRTAEDDAIRHRQDVSRRVNRGLLAGSAR